MGGTGQDLAIAYVLLGATWNELQNDLQIVATSAGLGGENKMWNHSWLPLVLDLGPVGERYMAH